MRYTTESSAAQWRHGSDGAAGIDLAAVEQVCLDSETPMVLVSLGVRVEIPHGHMGLLMPRSSLAGRGVMMVPGVIDSDYRGLIKARLYLAPWETEARVAQGERVAQLILLPCVEPVLWRWADDLRDTERGSCGFGSTGKM